MQRKSKLAIFDLDGTLFDTKNVNYAAYSKAMKICGIEENIDYTYYCQLCNGNNYKVFLPHIVAGITDEKMWEVHDIKKQLYKKYLHLARINEHLFTMIELIRPKYQIALVTSASKDNVIDILNEFNRADKFDLIITQEDVGRTKPDPECFEKAILQSKVRLRDTIIFEDSESGIKAAKLSGAQYIRVFGYN